MKAVNRKILSSFIFCISLLPLIFAGYVQLSEIVIHHQMKEELEQQNLVTIHVKASQLAWTKKGKEASINGNMFDVESYNIKGDEIVLTGLFDKDEDALFAQINNAQQKNNTDAAGSVSVLKWFSCFLSNINYTAVDIVCTQKIVNRIVQQNNFFQNPVLSCDTPPPKPIVI